jgi:cytochrome b561
MFILVNLEILDKYPALVLHYSGGLLLLLLLLLRFFVIIIYSALRSN